MNGKHGYNAFLFLLFFEIAALMGLTHGSATAAQYIEGEVESYDPDMRVISLTGVDPVTGALQKEQITIDPEGIVFGSLESISTIGPGQRIRAEVYPFGDSGMWISDEIQIMRSGGQTVLYAEGQEADETWSQRIEEDRFKELKRRQIVKRL